MSPNIFQMGCGVESLLGVQTAVEYTGRRKGGRIAAGTENVDAGESTLPRTMREKSREA